MKSARVISTLVFLLSFIPLTSISAQFQIDGYNLWINGIQDGRNLSLQGRISDGPQCSELELVARLKSDKRERKTIKTTLADCGGFGSRLINSAAVRVGLNERKWQVSEVRLRCLKD